MNNPSPGPGWWIASDGIWYPQKWEYTWFTSGEFDTPQGAVAKVVELADQIGQQGWEMLNYTMHSRIGQQQLGFMEYQNWSATAILKRPMAP
ncbi:MAG: hypothetical protein ACLPLP_01410 [Mycobacterium sp.]